MVAPPLVRAEGGDLEPIVVLHFDQPLGLEPRNHEHAGQSCNRQQTRDETVHFASNREVRGWPAVLRMTILTIAGPAVGDHWTLVQEDRMWRPG